MEYDRLDFVDAVETLAGEYHLEVPRESGFQPDNRQDNKQPLYQLLEQAAQLYQQELKQSQRAIDYLKQRGLSGEIARSYGLGYAPDSWDFILSRCSKNPAEVQALKTAGLIIEKSPSKHYDRFRDRIMFPIRDRRGRVIGFGGRILDQGEPKYLNSPETPVFHKGQELYGLYEARQALRNLDRILMVEGYMDVVALAQHGIAYAVATLGTATSQEQLSRLYRIVPDIVFSFDGDRAGREAAWRALENCLPVLRDGIEARFLFLPEGEDPDSLVRKEGQQAFEQRLQQAVPLSSFLLDHLQQQVNLETREGRARLSELARPLIARLQPGVFRDLLMEDLSARVGVSSGTLSQHLPQTETHVASDSGSESRQRKHKIHATPARLAIALLLQYPTLAQSNPLPDQLRQADIAGIPLLFRLHQTILQTGATSAAALIERWRGQPEEEALIKLLQWVVPGSEETGQQQKLLDDALANLGKQYRGQRLQQLIDKSQLQALTAEEKTELRELSSH